MAAFIADSLFSSDGIFAQPTDVLGPVAEVVRRAGGLFVADEVQSGFARSGERMWGYQRHGLDPDIVTMGKPMGNGYPVAGVLVVPEVVAAFGRDTRYFNTFGGNTVAMAAAQVTLDVIRDEGPAGPSGQVGAFLRRELAALAGRYPSRSATSAGPASTSASSWSRTGTPGPRTRPRPPPWSTACASAGC